MIINMLMPRETEGKCLILSWICVERFASMSEFRLDPLFSIGCLHISLWPNAEKFDPDRWIGTPEPSMYKYMVFNAGGFL